MPEFEESSISVTEGNSAPSDHSSEKIENNAAAVVAADPETSPASPQPSHATKSHPRYALKRGKLPQNRHKNMAKLEENASKSAEIVDVVADAIGSRKKPQVPVEKTTELVEEVSTETPKGNKSERSNNANKKKDRSNREFKSSQRSNKKNVLKSDVERNDTTKNSCCSHRHCKCGVLKKWICKIKSLFSSKKNTKCESKTDKSRNSSRRHRHHSRTKSGSAS